MCRVAAAIKSQHTIKPPCQIDYDKKITDDIFTVSKVLIKPLSTLLQTQLKQCQQSTQIISYSSVWLG